MTIALNHAYVDGRYLNSADLQEMYWNRKLTLLQIAKTIGVSSQTILNWMRKYEIPRRTNGEAHKGMTVWNQPTIPSVSEIKRVYYDERKTLGETAKIFRVSPRTLRKWVEQIGMQVRRLDETSPSKMSDFEQGFIVALIEGEGTISLGNYKKRNRVSYEPQIKISNKDKVLLERARNMLGCGTIRPTRREVKGKTETYYELSIGNHNAIVGLLSQIGKLFTEGKKKKRSDILREFCESRIRTIKKSKNGHADYTETEHQLAKSFPR